jgi:hypothetical protein
MNSRFSVVLALAFLAAVLTSSAADASWTGYIADSKCGAQAANDGARECTLKCVKAGAKYVFVNDRDKKVYAIDDQDQSKVADHAGHHVSVKGALDGQTLKLSSIEMAAKSN